jgi:hypothetical protein
MNNTKKQIKAIISGLLADDNQRVERIVRELSESIIPEKERDIMQIITESFRGDTHV